jgi:uncharacterized protein YegL
MANLQDRIEFATNPEQRCPVVLLLDNSYSMSGEPINELNKGIASFRDSILMDEVAALRVEVAIITFGNQEKLVHDFSTAPHFKPNDLKANGNTPMGAAINLALDVLDERKKVYKENGIPYYQPWIMLITDGEPTDDYKRAAQRVRAAASQRKLSFYCVAVKNADLKILTEIAPLETPPLPLEGLRFKELFKWLSASVRATSRHSIGEQVEIPDFSGWKRKNA